MSREEAIERTKKYNYLFGKVINEDRIAVVMPVPIDDRMTVEDAFSAFFNDLPYDKTLSNYDKFSVAVMFNYQEFLSTGTVMWKDLNDVLDMLELKD